MFQHVPDQLETYITYGDWYFWIQLSKLAKVFVNGQDLNNFRKHNHNVSEGANISGLSFIEGLRIIDLLYSESLITETAYYKAYKREFMQFWMDRSSTDKANEVIIRHMFRNSLSENLV